MSHSKMKCMGCGGEMHFVDGGEVEDTESQPAPVAGANSKEPSMKQRQMADSMRKAFHGDGYADGGFVGEEEASGYHEMPMSSEYDEGHDIVHDIMMSRAEGYSEGGQVANDVGTGEEADKEPNQFDDLVKDDDLEEHYTGKNSGDEVGNEEHDEEDEDMVDSIMKSRKKKDRNPSPA